MRRLARALRAVVREEEVQYRLDQLVASRVDPTASVVVLGFWRSGTTWLQQTVAAWTGAKTVYEPLHPMAPAMARVYGHRGLPTEYAPFLELYMPYSGSGAPADDPLSGYLADALRARIPGRIVRLLRAGTAESLRTRVVVKCVRAQLCLRTIHDVLRMPVLHIHRDPRAVVASARRVSWAWLFDHLRLAEQLLEPADGRAAFFDRWGGEIRSIDRLGPLARIAGYWALTELFVQTAFGERPSRMASVAYEDLVRKGPGVLEDALDRLGVRGRSPAAGRAPGWPDQDVEARLGGWRGVLSADEVGAVRTIAGSLGLGHRVADA